MEGKDFLKGADVSPYCNIKLRTSFFPTKLNPCSSATSRSNQDALGYNSVIDFK